MNTSRGCKPFHRRTETPLVAMFHTRVKHPVADQWPTTKSYNFHRDAVRPRAGKSGSGGPDRIARELRGGSHGLNLLHLYLTSIVLD